MISSTSLVLITFFLGSSWMATGFVVTPKTPFPSIATTMTPTRLSSSITTSQDFGPSNSKNHNKNQNDELQAAATSSLTVPESTTNKDLMALSSSQVKESSSAMSDSSMNLFQEAMAGILWGDASTMTVLVAVVVVVAAAMSLTVFLSILATATDLAASSSSPLLEWHEWAWAARDGYLGTMVHHALRNGGHL